VLGGGERTILIYVLGGMAGEQHIKKTCRKKRGGKRELTFDCKEKDWGTNTVLGNNHCRLKGGREKKKFGSRGEGGRGKIRSLRFRLRKWERRGES